LKIYPSAKGLPALYGHQNHSNKACGDDSIDVKSGKLEGIEMPIDKGFSDIELFSRL